MQEQQADIAWERGVQDRKAVVNERQGAHEEAAQKEKDALRQSADAVENALEKAADGIELSAEEIRAAASALQSVLSDFSGGSVSAKGGTQLYQSTTDGRTFHTNVNFMSQGLTADQIARAVTDALMSEPVL